MRAKHTARTRLTQALAASVLLHGALLASFASPRLKPGGHQLPAALEVSLTSLAAEQSLPAPAVPTPQVSPVAFAAAPAKPNPEKTFQTDQGEGKMDSPPQPLADIAPEYPESAFALGLSGKVEVDVWVDETGRIENATVVATTMADAFNRSALKAVHDTRFTPGMSGGKPVKSSLRAVIVYELQ